MKQVIYDEFCCTPVIWVKSFWVILMKDNKPFSYHCLKRVEFLSSSFITHSWYQWWVSALFQCRFKKYVIEIKTYVKPYNNKTVEFNILKSKFISAKREYSRVYNLIESFKNKESLTIFGVDNSHPFLIAAYSKLSVKLEKLTLAEKNLMSYERLDW